MRKYLGVKVAINGSNKNIHNCIECGKELSFYEYNEMTDMCKRCKRKGYDAGRRIGLDILGNNRVDEILNTKLGGEID